MDTMKEEESLTCAYCLSKFKNKAELSKHIVYLWIILNIVLYGFCTDIFSKCHMSEYRDAPLF